MPDHKPFDSRKGLSCSHPDQQDPAEWGRMISVNINGVLNGLGEFIGKMKKRKGGTVINLSSIAGVKGFPNHMAYCGTKFAVHGVSETLREEVADDNVRVITVAPGVVGTELLSHTASNDIKDGYESWKDRMGGVIHPEDIASCVSFAYNQPQNVCVREIVVSATRQQP
ncbi:SDR family oxidoreductase [Endozoicomonas numazuensis]|uniref:SDR family oxidoreductase n=1 Tax=Endozoicomonas numazuensis TaxID=1137799 RepID=UPI0022A9EF41|nr:SDR family oxidoreductase [Endozoicomonas numazuensis]